LQVCLHFARNLLQQEGRRPLDQFLEEWQASVPEVRAPFLSRTRPQIGISRL
jgi:hypothetical protein